MYIFLNSLNCHDALPQIQDKTMHNLKHMTVPGSDFQVLSKRPLTVRNVVSQLHSDWAT